MSEPATQRRSPPDAPAGTPADRVICYCFDISESDIRKSLADPTMTIDGLIDRTGLGTKCTACLLDVELVLDQIVDSRDHPLRAPNLSKGPGTKPAKGHLYPHNQLESGVLIEDGATHTRLRCVNKGLHFGDVTKVVPYKYWLRVFSGGGALKGRRDGILNPDDSLDIAFADLVSPPFNGWFLLALKPTRPGLEGSIRPQIALSGANFVATVHTQPYWSACRQKSVLMLPGERGFSASISVINATSKASKLSLVAATPAGKILASHSHDLAPRGACMLDLDAHLGLQPAGQPLIVRITSDRPVRKHIITHLADGRLGIDHFPNSK